MSGEDPFDFAPALYAVPDQTQAPATTGPDQGVQAAARTWLLRPHLLHEHDCDGQTHRLRVRTDTTLDEETGDPVPVLVVETVDHETPFDVDAETFMVALSGQPANGCLRAALTLAHHRPFGVTDPSILSDHIRGLAAYATARLWAHHETAHPDQAWTPADRADLIASYTSPEQWQPWAEAGIRPHTAKQFLIKRVGIDAASPWLRAGLTTVAAAEQAAQGRVVDLDIDDWTAYGFTRSQARTWYTRVQCDPVHARGFADLGLDPAGTQFFISQLDKTPATALTWLSTIHGNSDRDPADLRRQVSVGWWYRRNIPLARAHAFESIGVNHDAYLALGRDLYLHTLAPPPTDGPRAGLPHIPELDHSAAVRPTITQILTTAATIDVNLLAAWRAFGYTKPQQMSSALTTPVTPTDLHTGHGLPDLPDGIAHTSIHPANLAYAAAHIPAATWAAWMSTTADNPRWAPTNPHNGPSNGFSRPGATELVRGIVVLHHHGLGPDDYTTLRSAAAPQYAETARHPDYLAEILLSALDAAVDANGDPNGDPNGDATGPAPRDLLSTFLTSRVPDKTTFVVTPDTDPEVAVAFLRRRATEILHPLRP